MCFSASASFTASVVLVIISIALVSQVKSIRFFPLALVPFFFALQQAAEGVVWMELPLSSFAKNIFLFFAYVFWPIWIPLSLWLVEKENRRKQLLSFFLGCGLVTGLFLFFKIPVSNAINYRHSIQYLSDGKLNNFEFSGLFFYGVATLLPLFTSSLKRIWILGLFISLAGVIIFWIDRHFFVSMWCFFAALLSFILFFVFYHSDQMEKRKH